MNADEGLLVRGGKVVEKRHADISDDELYRFTLLRSWTRPAPPMLFVMLNPSTADALEDDPTIRRCRGFAEREGCGGIAVVNLYAYRTPKPTVLWAARDEGVDIVGPDNDDWIVGAVDAAVELGGPIVAAWGAGADPERAAAVTEMIQARPGATLQALAITKAGMPGHPLYLKGDSELRPFPDGAPSVSLVDRTQEGGPL